MLSFPPFNPIALSLPAFRLPLSSHQIGPLSIHWYGVMYGLAFFIGYFVIRAIARRKGLPLAESELGDLVTNIMIGVILGGRLGYILFYGLSGYLKNPLEIFAIWHGGMSFHGGAIGTFLAGWLFCRKRGLPFLRLADTVIPAVPIGLGLGRLGNFINAELWGRPSGMPWAMVFPTDPLSLPRHPSQLYEFGLEGVFLFLILWFFSRRSTPDGAAFGLFLVCYGTFRFCAEFFRNPDAQLGLILGPFSMGQILCLPMVAIGIALWIWTYLKKRAPALSP
ncbi:MAG TPA: prolipoprotein diacylglyceryl transferase [Chroococcales cyanobacterium]|jgi:phosphatidylglycerol:prolipoprotein diacylglycerol transferase